MEAFSKTLPETQRTKRRGAAEELERRDLAGSVIPCSSS